MITLSKYIFHQFLDDVGDPLSGGKLYTYQAGTTTYKQTHQDALGDAQHTNPIILDPAGRLPGASGLFLDEGAYKFKLTNSDESWTKTLDKIYGQDVTQKVDNLTELKALAVGEVTLVRTLGYYTKNDGGDGVYYYDSTSTATADNGAVVMPDSNPVTGRWHLLHSKVINARKYGCKVDGSTDDVAKIQLCDTYCQTNNISIIIDGTILFATNPAILSKVILEEKGIIKWTANYQPTYNISIDRNSKVQHFDCPTSYEPILNTDYWIPEWFGETSSSHPKMSASIAASTGLSHWITGTNFIADTNDVLWTGEHGGTKAVDIKADNTDVTITTHNSDNLVLTPAGGTVIINGSIRMDDSAYIGIDSDADLLQLTSGVLRVNGYIRMDDSAYIGIDSDADLLQFTTGTLVVNGHVRINDGSSIGVDGDTDLLVLSGAGGYLEINGNLRVSTDGYLGCDGDTDLLQFILGVLRVNGYIRMDDSAYIGIDSDADLLQLTSGVLRVNGYIRMDDSAYIGIDSDADLLQFTTGTLVVNGHVRINDGSSIGVDGDTDLLVLSGSGGYLEINGNLRVSTNGYLGCDGDIDLLQLTSSTLVINGNIQIDNNALIGIDSDTDLLQLTSGVLYVNGHVRIGGGDLRVPTNGYIGCDADTDLLQLTSGVLRVNGYIRMDDSAYIGIDSDADLLQLTSGVLVVNGNGRFTSIGSGPADGTLYYTSDGTLTTGASDIRLKKGIVSLTDSLNKIMQLRSIKGKWKKNNSILLGFIAQEVEKVIPEAVFTNSADGYKGIHTDYILATLVNAVQELSRKVDLILHPLS